MAIVDITTKEQVENLGENDLIFVNYQGTLRQIKKSDLHDITKLDKNLGTENAEKILTIDSEGNVIPSNMPFIPDEVLIDKTLNIDGQAADSKAVGDALKTKANSSEIPEALPNPNKIIFTGAVTEEYNGSSEKTINIPEEINVGNTSITFSQAQDRTNIDTGDTISVLFGKIKKWLSELKIVAFTGKYSDLSETPTTMTGATSSNEGASGFVPAPASGEQSSFLRGDGTWATPASTTYSQMTGATSSEPGQTGLVPAPTSGTQNKFLRGDGTWNDPTSKIYENKLVTLDEINLVTEPGFFVDALAVKEGFNQLNGKIGTLELICENNATTYKTFSGLDLNKYKYFVLNCGVAGSMRKANATTIIPREFLQYTGASNMHEASFAKEPSNYCATMYFVSDSAVAIKSATQFDCAWLYGVK